MPYRLVLHLKRIEAIILYVYSSLFLATLNSMLWLFIIFKCNIRNHKASLRKKTRRLCLTEEIVNFKVDLSIYIFFVACLHVCEVFWFSLCHIVRIYKRSRYSNTTTMAGFKFAQIPNRVKELKKFTFK